MTNDTQEASIDQVAEAVLRTGHHTDIYKFDWWFWLFFGVVSSTLFLFTIGCVHLCCWEVWRLRIMGCLLLLPGLRWVAEPVPGELGICRRILTRISRSVRWIWRILLKIGRWIWRILLKIGQWLGWLGARLRVKFQDQPLPDTGLPNPIFEESRELSNSTLSLPLQLAPLPLPFQLARHVGGE